MTQARAARRLSKCHASDRGFTLVELMGVVAIVAVLATLAVFGMRKYIMASKTSEAVQMIGTIAAAQEQYKAETFTYKDVSGKQNLDDTSTFYPRTSPLDNSKAAWGGGDATISAAWKELGVSSSAPVLYIYGCAAGPGSVAPAAPGITIGGYPTAATGQPWYLIKAIGSNIAPGTWVGISSSAEIFHDIPE